MNNYQPFTAIRRAHLAICDNDIYQAAVISIIDYFIHQRIENFNKHHGISSSDYLQESWNIVPITYPDFQERGLNKHACETAIQKLIARGFVIRYTKVGKDNGTYYYSLDYQKIKDAIEAAKQKIARRRKWTPTFDPDDLEDEYMRCNKIGEKSTKG